ncbi:chromosome partitioning protein stage 0 sporulation protein j (plasmid) [Candidatus Burkholderia crenata]|nr:chromosome partitioning protein stage 0 sporulation protein j [Candidatus Burkholderia crenata]
MAKKMAERTSGIDVERSKRMGSISENAPATSTGRLLDAQLRVNDAIDRADAAESRAAQAEATRVTLESSLAEARQQLARLEASPTSAAEDVLVNSLIEVPGRRRILSTEEYAELRSNLEASALIHPIVYMPVADGKNEIISGHNRVHIYRELERERIKAVQFFGTQDEAEMGAAFSNLLAPSLPDFEKYRQFERMRKLSGFSQSDIIRLSGLTQGHVARIFSFANLPQKAKDLIAKSPHKLGGHAAQKLAMLSEQGQGNQVVEAIGRLVADSTLTQEKAIALASPKPKVASLPTVQTFSRGKRKVCEMSVRNTVIGLRFSGKDGQALATDWSGKIAEFIKTELIGEK